jgi:hypothetical protein
MRQHLWQLRAGRLQAKILFFQQVVLARFLAFSRSAVVACGTMAKSACSK